MYEINRNASVEYTPRAPMQAIVVYFKTKCKPSVRNLKLKIIKQYAIKLSKNSYYEIHIILLSQYKQFSMKLVFFGLELIKQL